MHNEAALHTKSACRPRVPAAHRRWLDPPRRQTAAMTDASQVCSGTSGRVIPVIDRNRCEAKADCVRVCPYGVFSIQKLTTEDRANLSLRGRLKAFFHGAKQAYTPKADQCHACGLCVSACPEGAITLLPASSVNR